jgi:hypothetical protein
MTTNSEQDELIFDFLEGNLSPDEEEAFIMLKEESEVFNRQVRLWQNTYFDEPLPSVKVLEEKLLIKPNTHSGNFPTRIYTVLIIMFMFAVTPEDRTRKPGSETFKVLRNVSKTIPHQDQIENLQTDLNFKENKTKSTSRENHSQVVTEVNESEYQSVVLSYQKPESLFKPQEFTLQKIGLTKNKSRKPTSVVVRKKWTGREKRQIRKKRIQDRREREANEFLKGNVPYVVPLKSNNF